EQLVLGRGEARRPGLLLAPVQEAAQLVAQVEQALVVGIRDADRIHVVIRYIDRAMIPTTSPARLLRLTALAGAVGLAAGGAAWALVHLIGLITNLALFNLWGWALPC